MTTKHDVATAEPSPFVRFPDYQPSEETANTFFYLNFPGYPAALSRCFGNRETTIVTSQAPASPVLTPNRQRLRYPDLLIAFDVDPKAFEARNGYLIPEQGKPPDFVLEIASKNTGRSDETSRRADYGSMGVLEYWRFDHTGGEYHSAPLAGDRLVDGKYVPIEIARLSGERYRGYSGALNLDLCWEHGKLRWYDPVARRYLLTYNETDDARIAAKRERIAAEQHADAARRKRIAEQRADMERRERIAAEQRADAAEQRAEEEHAARLALEAELRRLRGQ